jgi:hypothetical protein
MKQETLHAAHLSSHAQHQQGSQLHQQCSKNELVAGHGVALVCEYTVAVQQYSMTPDQVQ